MFNQYYVTVGTKGIIILHKDSHYYMFTTKISIAILNLFSFLPVVSSTAGTDHEITAAGPTAAGSWGWQLRLEWGSLLWACQGRKVPSSYCAGDAAGSREALEAAAATESPAAEGPCKFA